MSQNSLNLLILKAFKWFELTFLLKPQISQVSNCTACQALDWSTSHIEAMCLEE